MEQTVPLNKLGALGGILLAIHTSCWLIGGRRDMGLTLSTQHYCDVLQPCKAEISGFPKILFCEVLAHCQIGRPVAAAALFSFLASRVVAALACEGKAGDLIQPGKPFRAIRDN